MTINQHLSSREVRLGTKFVPRIPELLALEGWYSFLSWPDYEKRKFKLSCRWKDFLRASDSKHFRSCFSSDGCYKQQPVARLRVPTWCVIYLPDKAGNILARAYAEYGVLERYWPKASKENVLWISKIYGNHLEFKDVGGALQHIIRVEGREDMYI